MNVQITIYDNGTTKECHYFTAVWGSYYGTPYSVNTTGYYDVLQIARLKELTRRIERLVDDFYKSEFDKFSLETKDS